MKNIINDIIQAINEVCIIDSAFSPKIQLFLSAFYDKQVTKHFEGIKEGECVIKLSESFT